MKNIPDPHHRKVTGESLSFCFDPLIWQVTPTKWTALQLKLFNCSLISFIILLIRISAVSSEWKICISWIILTRGPFNFCQQYFTAPIRACSHWCRSPPGMSEDSALLTAPNHPGAGTSRCCIYYCLPYSCISLQCRQPGPWGSRQPSSGSSAILQAYRALGCDFPFPSPQQTRQGEFLIKTKH